MTSALLALVPALALIPQPQTVRAKEGVFRAAAPRILVESAFAREDRVAAATLVEELAARDGKATIASTAPRARPPAGAIYLARLTGKSPLRAALAARGFAVDKKLDEEGYLLDADERGIVVAAETAAGLFYGVQTLRQLLAVDAHEVVVPALQIEDHPAMRWRAVHDDISRGPVPTLAYMKKQVRVISEYKLNMYALYMEGIFDYQSQPLIAPKEGAVTAAELRELVAYAARYHVTIVPEQQTFGHLHQMLRYEQYGDVAERPNGQVLTPTVPRTYDIIKSLYGELVPLFPGPFVHIGGDETAELGAGKTRDLIKRDGEAKVYLEHLKRVSEILKPYDRRLMFWTDIAVNYPESLQILPKELIAVTWNYAPQADYDSSLKPFQKAGLAIFVSPSAHNYKHPFPDFDAAFLNIKNFVRDGQKYEALGLLNTTWDDDGEQLFDNVWPAVIFGGACAWQRGESSIERFWSDYDWAFLRHRGHDAAEGFAALAQLHALHRKAGVGTFDVADVWREVFSPEGANYVKRLLPVTHDFRLAAERAMIAFERARGGARLHGDTLGAPAFAALVADTQGLRVEHANDIARFYNDAYQNQKDRRRLNHDLYEISATDGRLQDLRDLTARLRAIYAELWRSENRPYLLQNVLAQFDLRLQGLTARINTIAEIKDPTISQGVPMPTPAQLGFVSAP